MIFELEVGPRVIAAFRNELIAGALLKAYGATYEDWWRIIHMEPSPIGA